MKSLFSMIFLTLLLSPLAATAGNFQLRPLKILLDAGQKSETLHITNLDSRPVTLQVQAKSWSQNADGKPVYQDTRELIFFPQIFTMAPKEERIVRIAAKQPPGKTEHSYRLFVEELPDKTARGGNSLTMLLKMSIPVLIAPVTEIKKQGEIIAITTQNGKPAVTLKNSGNSYFMVKTIQTQGRSADGQTTDFPERDGWYLLSGATATYPLPIEPEQCRNLSALQLTVHTDAFDLNRTFAVDDTICPL